MMYTLFIDTHFKDVVIAIYQDGKLLKKDVSDNQRHSVVTMPMIVSALDSLNIKAQDIGEIVVINGPGSFTGIRIAITIGKMLAYTLNIPIKAVDYLQVMAWFANTDYVSIVDRNGAFVGHFDKDRKPIEEYKYYNKSDYADLVANNGVCEEVNINYDDLYAHLKGIEDVNPHLINPLYVKNIEV